MSTFKLFLRKINAYTITMMMMGITCLAFASTNPPINAWITHYNGAAYGDDKATKVVYDSVGNVYVTGNSTGISYDLDIATVKYDATGNQLWVVSYDGHGLADGVNDLTVDNSGNVYVSGYSWVSNDDNSEYVTLKYDTAGNQLWVATYDNGGLDAATALAVDSAGNVYVTGNSENIFFGKDYTTIKYDSAGNQLWVVKHDDGESIAEARDIAVDSSGNVYITGTGAVNSSRNYTTIKYDGSGSQVWVARYDNENNQTHDDAYALTMDTQENIYVTGISSNGADDDFATVKYDSVTGSQLWVSRYNNGMGDQANSIVLDEAGNAYVTGNSVNSAGAKDYATLKYDAVTGDQLWVSRYNNGGNDSPQDIAIDNVGNVYVTGYSDNAYGDFDYATVKYSSVLGAQLWVNRHDDGPSDKAVAISVDSFGNVYVTGSNKNQYFDDDYFTIKYAQATGPDLVMTAVSGPSEGFRGQSIVISSTVVNQGADPATYFRVGYYLSTDASITTEDLFLGERNLNAGLAGGASSSSSGSVFPLTIPSNLVYGTYYIGAIADHNNFVEEADENNNALTGNMITIPKPDLITTAVSGPSEGFRGQSIVISSTVVNQGAGPATYFRIGYYLSTDANITTADLFLGERNLNAGLAGGASSSSSGSVFPLTIPSNLVYGTYYIGAISDHNNFVEEDNEGNNALTGNSIVISP